MNILLLLKQSVLLGPFLRLASVSSLEIETCWNESVLGSLCQKTIALAVEALKPCSKAWPVLGGALSMLHIASIIGIFVAATLFETDEIAIVTGASFLLGVLHGLVRTKPFRFGAVDVIVTFFFMMAVLATAFSSYTHSSVIGLLKFMVFYTGYLSFRVCLSQAEQSLRIILVALFLLGVGESLVGLYQFVNHVQPLATWQDTSINPEDQLVRIFGTLKPYNPNLLAGFLIPCLSAGVALGLEKLFHKQVVQVGLLLMGVSIILLALVLTGSRGGFLSLGVMGTITFLGVGHILWHEEQFKPMVQLRALWLFTLLGVVGIVAMALVGVPALRNRVLSIFAMREDSSNSYRLNVWASTWRMIQDNGLLGIGPGNDTFKQVYGLYMIPGYNALSAYSIFLEMWAEQGVFGLLSFLVLIFISLLRLVIVLFSEKALSEKLLLIGLFSGLLGSVIYGVFDTIWYRPAVNLLFWFLVATLATISEPERQKSI
jgi:putative inorganic carbon (hco3(-)) transporter